MASHPGAEEFLPKQGGLAALRSAAATCHGCDLYKDAKQTVFSEGRVKSRVMMIGEEPGDREDVEGAPFVGPAGRLLDKVLAEAGIDRGALYLTNAVKHFSFRQDERGKRRIHQRPKAGQIAACLPWLAAELRIVRPELVVCLGAVAAQAVAGSHFRVTDHRGKQLPHPDTDLPGKWPFLTTVHPSAVLRADDRKQAYQDLLADLRPVAKFLD